MYYPMEIDHDYCARRHTCRCRVGPRQRDFRDYASEIADWDATPEDIAFAFDGDPAQSPEELFGRSVDRCFGLHLIDD